MWKEAEAFPGAFRLGVNPMCLEPFSPATFATISKIRFLLDFDTPSWDANVVADFTGNESVSTLAMSS
jgi:hypothetical protein